MHYYPIGELWEDNPSCACRLLLHSSCKNGRAQLMQRGNARRDLAQRGLGVQQEEGQVNDAAT
jgi:hypothetical protein